MPSLQVLAGIVAPAAVASGLSDREVLLSLLPNMLILETATFIKKEKRAQRLTFESGDRPVGWGFFYVKGWGSNSCSIASLKPRENKHFCHAILGNHPGPFWDVQKIVPRKFALILWPLCPFQSGVRCCLPVRVGQYFRSNVILFTPIDACQCLSTTVNISVSVSHRLSVKVLPSISFCQCLFFLPLSVSLPLFLLYMCVTDL